VGLFFIIGIFLLSGITLSSAMRQTVNNIWGTIPPVVTLRMDWEASESVETQSYVPQSNFGLAFLDEVEEMSQVQAVDYHLPAILWSTDIDWSGWGELGLDFMPMQLLGSSQGDSILFESGALELISGRRFTKEEVINRETNAQIMIISETFAEQHQLSVGSMVELHEVTTDYDGFINHNPEAFNDSATITTTYYLEVVGIFRQVASDAELDEFFELNAEWTQSHWVFVPLPFTESLLPTLKNPEPGSYDYRTILQEALFHIILYDSADLPEFLETAKDVIPYYWEIQTLSYIFSPLTTITDEMDMLGTFMLLGTLIASGIILSLIGMISLKSRSAEIGIYLALGKRKLHIFLQTIMEIFFVAIPALVLAFFTGKRISERLIFQMVLNQLNAMPQNYALERRVEESNAFSVLDFFHPGYPTAQELMESFEGLMTFGDILQFLFFCLLAIVIGILLPSLHILFKKPSDILRD